MGLPREATNGSKIKSLIYLFCPPPLKSFLNKRNNLDSIYPFPIHSQQTQQSSPTRRASRRRERKEKRWPVVAVAAASSLLSSLISSPFLVQAPSSPLCSNDKRLHSSHAVGTGQTVRLRDRISLLTALCQPLWFLQKTRPCWQSTWAAPEAAGGSLADNSRTSTSRIAGQIARQQSNKPVGPGRH